MKSCSVNLESLDCAKLERDYRETTIVICQSGGDQRVCVNRDSNKDEVWKFDVITMYLF